jgi:hypothetical protein
MINDHEKRKLRLIDETESVTNPEGGECGEGNRGDKIE